MSGKGRLINLLLHSLHAVLHVFHIASCVLLFKQRYVKFSKPVGKIQSKELGIPGAHGVLGKISGLCVDIAFSCSKDIADAQSQGGNFILHKIPPDCRVHAVAWF